MSLASDAGIDVNICEFCDQRVRRNAPSSAVIVGLDGMRAHRICVTSYRRREPKGWAAAGYRRNVPTKDETK